jgi:hypothetical protein
MLIQFVALIAIFAAGVPERFFETGIFHLAAAVSILSMVAVTRYFARSAFVAAIDRGDVGFLRAQRRLGWVSATCPRRKLVILHARFAGFRGDVFSMAEPSPAVPQCAQKDAQTEASRR